MSIFITCQMNYYWKQGNSFDVLIGNDKKVGHLWGLEGAKERLQLVRADLLEEGSFDDAVMACDGVFHTASPVITKSDSKACQTPILTTALSLETEGFSSCMLYAASESLATEIYRCHFLQEEMLDSAINGTLNVLRSCKKNPSLKRVVLTSSSATVRIKDETDLPPNVLLDETSWSSIEYCESLQVSLRLSNPNSVYDLVRWFSQKSNLDRANVLPP